MERIWGELGEEKAHDQNIAFSNGVTLGLSTTLGDYFLTRLPLEWGRYMCAFIWLQFGDRFLGRGVVLFYFIFFVLGGFVVILNFVRKNLKLGRYEGENLEGLGWGEYDQKIVKFKNCF